MLQDLRYALRNLLSSPGLSTVVILSVALGIGVNTAIFSFLGATVLRPIPGIGNDVITLQVNEGSRISGGSWAEYNDIRERLAPLAEVSAQNIRALYADDGARTERIWAEFVSGNFLSTFGVRPALGRFFLPTEANSPGSAPVVVISHALWQRRFGGSPDALGQTFRLNNVPLTVIGVTPPAFHGGVMALSFDAWIPATMAARLTSDPGQYSQRGYRAYGIDAVLRPGVTRAQVQQELDLLGRALATDFPDSNKEITFRALPIWRGTRSGELLLPVYATLQIFAILVLAVVSINTANLLLARATVRRREIGIRLAVGAGPGRIIRQLLTESILLALAGTALGIIGAWWGVDAVNYLKMPTSVPVTIVPVFDFNALLFAIGVGGMCGVLFGLTPALQLARLDVLSSLRSGAGALTGRHRFRDFLVGAEVAVALVVLILAALFYRSFHNAQTVNPGYDTDRVLLASIDLLGRGYRGERRTEFVRAVQTRLLAHPGIESAALSTQAPLELHGLTKALVQVDGAKLASDAQARVIWTPATPGYFSTMGIPLVAGTDLAPLDQADRSLDVVVNETAARQFWPDRPALGHTLTVNGKAFTVVGVARDTKYESLGEAPIPAAWPTFRAGALAAPSFYVRVRSGDALAMLPAVRQIVREVDADLALYEGRTLAQHIDNNLAIQRVSANFLSALAPFALLLAGIGLYAVLAYAVAQRTREIGVRLTLGATPRGVVFQVMREGMWVVALGTAAGWAIAFTFGWYLRPKLIGVPVGDPVIYAGVPAVLLAVAILACWLPARRAAKVDPMVALRSE